MKVSNIDIFEEVKEISKLLDVIDLFDNSVSEEMANYGYKLSDLYHKLENMNLTAPKCYKFCKELKNVLQERRTFKNNVELLHEYKNNKNKLISGIENRQQLLSVIGKREKQLNCPYKPRIYTEEELNEKIGV